ncbi:hypothetical protein BDP27DRAFT_1215405 [Rhodocollybia butyracea]|uniref:Uncharacterized protein n=1 Tax=Rhodocollybia butyracea TaxID=206335 RepID=A0A9P5Q3C1_9AGAR|nr:hypothetical protein BDP27DRAFT_1215405 [Rhodocollybia butyracea]
MNFGVGVGDVYLVAKFAWNIYKACKESGDDFRKLSSEVASLHVVLKESEEYIDEYTDLPASRRNRLKILTDGCDGVLKDLDKLLKTYESLGTQSQRTWDRMRFGLEDLADIRSRLISQTTLLTAFNSILISSSIPRMEKRLVKLITEVQAGQREGSVVSLPDITETIESPDVWNQLRRELEDVGITPVVVEENHDYIINWMKAALTQGLVDEVSPGSGHLNVMGNIGLGSMGSASSTITIVGNEEFEEELQRKQAEKPFGGVIQVQSVKVRKKTDPTRMIKKLFVKDTAIVQAASDGDLDKVVNLISIGCNVNVTDRWGWSALSMAAYGNHLTIARVLLDHGASLDNIDVDGDSPYQLATNRGHSDMLILFDQVTAERDLHAREQDTEKPRQ